MTHKKLCYTVSELYDILPLGKNALYKLVNQSDFPKIKVGKKILIPTEGLLQWIQKSAHMQDESLE